MHLFDLKPKDSRADLYGRRDEIERIKDLIEHGSWVVLLGPRMVGKTSIAKVASSDLPRQYTSVYLNLYGVNSSHALLQALAHGVSTSRTLFEKIKDVLRRTEEFSVGADSFSIKVASKPMTRIGDIIAAIGSLKHNTVFILDEVQELSVISGHLLKLLANIFNTYNNITFIFTGSMIGLLRALLEPKSTSPLYGRTPARLYIRPFDELNSLKFLEQGFKGLGKHIEDSEINEAVNNLDGIPGWLTLYGNNAAIKKLSHNKALEQTRKEATKIIKDELEHFLVDKDRSAYIQALKVASYASASWTEIRKGISMAKGTKANDLIVKTIIDNLVAVMYLVKDESTNTYTVADPLVRYTVKTMK